MTQRSRTRTPLCPWLLALASAVFAVLLPLAAAAAEVARQFDGTTAAPAASLADWRQVMFELRASATAKTAWPAARSLAQSRRAGVPRNVVPLGVIQVGATAFEAPDGVPPSGVFVFAPLRERVYNGGDFSFVLDPQAVLIHDAPQPRSWWFDADDGYGQRRIEPGVPVPVSYSSTGTRTLTLQAQSADGGVLQAAATVDVPALVTPDPTETWAVTASVPWDGQVGSGQAYVYLAEGHVSLTNPVVVVEGFDIDNSMDWPVLYELLNRENLLEDLRADGYDAVVLDFTEAVDPIQRNALVLTELLQMVLAAIPPEQTVAVVGASAGGLISRYALLWMEDQALPHRVRNWISFDSPHDGANIPLGLQTWLRFFSTQAEPAAYLLDRLRTPAARQLLLYHVDSTIGTSAAPDPLHADLAADLLSLGDWPQQTRRVAVINGSGAQADQGFAAGDPLLQWEFSGLGSLITGNVWAVPDGGSQTVFDGLLSPPVGETLQEVLTVNGTLPWDNAPGGYSATLQQAASVNVPVGEIVALQDFHDFVPTVSALALGAVHPFHDLDSGAGLPQSTPFDEVYVPAENQEHIAITPESKAWFRFEIGLNLPGPVFNDGFETSP
ncbi:esterase/lipase family protein [Elongatibacter sediminis]|uniref:DUF676 domain-containing protein n=1 Tax=Elongatibacter sediminis TaxID=3119006 RepID=A0AAW9RFW8_9GAMM